MIIIIIRRGAALVAGREAGALFAGCFEARLRAALDAAAVAGAEAQAVRAYNTI